MTTTATPTQWVTAQRYERECWMETHTTSENDRSEYYERVFYNYRAIPAGPYAKVLEMGCGPFTQSRYISRVVDMGSITLVDPLIDDYLTLDRCAYRGGPTWVGDVETVKSKGEDFCRPGEFDMAVCINVLPHCQDAGRVVANLVDSLKPGGALVFGEPFFPDGTKGSGMHPIAPTLPWLREQVASLEPLYDIEVPRGHYEDFCMIGVKAK